MAKRRSIHIEGLSHLTAIPVGTRIGPLLVSSVIAAFNPGTREVPPNLEDQIRNIFTHVGSILAAGGGTWHDVAKMEFWAGDAAARAALDVPWVEHFPDPASRPSRHTHIGGQGVSASFVAYIDN